MKKNVKKLLLLATSLLLIIVSMSVVSFATVNTEPLVIDLNSGGTQYTVNPTYYNRINYIITGNNPEAEIIVWGSCNITLQNATFRRLYVDYSDSYDINITLSGENTIDQYNWASQGALEIYSSNVTISGGENDSLYAASKAFTVYSSSHNLGNLIVNGGKVTFEARNTACTFQTNYIQNGGTVKVVCDNAESFLYNLTLNGGYLEVQHNSSSKDAFVGYVKINKGAFMKVSSPSKAFGAYGIIGLTDNSDANDCAFS